jgi:chromosome segregation ATPase
MAENNAFLQEFRVNMEKLSQINVKADKNIQFRKELSSKTYARLIEINKKLQVLIGQIRDLKSLADNLQNEVNQNTKNIGDKTGEIDSIKAQIQQLQAENKKLIEENSILKQKCKEEIDAKEKENMNTKLQIQELIEKNKTLENSIKALQNELSGKGDNEANHAAELAALNEQHKKQIQQLIEENKKQIEQLSQIIENKDKEIENLKSQIKQIQDAEKANNDSFVKNVNEEKARIANLVGQIDVLKRENDELITRLKEANVAIINALGKLDELSNPENYREDDEKIDHAITDIENYLMEISSAIQGKTLTTNGAVAKAQQNKIPKSEIINVTGIGGIPIQITYGDLIEQLRNKAQQEQRNPNTNPKHINALKELEKVSNTVDIIPILKKFNIDFKENGIFGGKKTKKIRKGKKGQKTRKGINKNGINKKIQKKQKTKKQKGGFLYKTNSHRKSLRSSISSK